MQNARPSVPLPPSAPQECFLCHRPRETEQPSTLACALHQALTAADAVSHQLAPFAPLLKSLGVNATVLQKSELAQVAVHASCLADLTGTLSLAALVSDLRQSPAFVLSKAFWDQLVSRRQRLSSGPNLA